ncbi:HNH endonuclease [Dissulfurirhabdus thermomarina]|uniref:HNH endonuclease n=1 Tax=Dissulfurirhabdus thermomarina TaxID=1765737 RepID=UPI002852F1E0|nr:HNH endonuclease signature motif containing protein [Dissulfurirhabdus thermomarina]
MAQERSFHLPPRPPDEERLRREKQRARELRRTRWWRRKCAAGRCHYCGRFVGAAALTMDHVVPLARGGTSERHNLVPACKDCNNRKKYLLPVEWERYLASLSHADPGGETA